MKASVLTALAWAACTAASPVFAQSTHLQCTCQPEEPQPGTSVPVSPAPAPAPEPAPSAPSDPAPKPEPPVPSAPGGPAAPPTAAPSVPSAPSGPAGPSGPSVTAPAPEPPVSVPSSISVTVPSVTPAPNPEPVPSVVPSVSTPAPPTSTPSTPDEGNCDDHGCHGTGHLLQDEAPKLGELLTVIGEHSEALGVKLGPSVGKLVSSLGLPGGPIGDVVKSGGSIGELLADLGEPTELLVHTTGKDGGNSLIKLGPSVEGLLKALGQDNIAQPVGSIVSKLGSHLKKRTDGLVEDVAPIVRCILEIAGEDTKMSLVELSEPVAGLVAGLGLTEAAGPVGEIVKTVASVGDLLVEIAPIVECILIILGEDGSMTLVDLSPEVAGLLGDAAGEIVKTVGEGF
ncbi:hypothetical protein ATERTT37_004282 [Aspergillus terreus]